MPTFAPEIKVENVEDGDVYNNHSTYHEGDAGLDLFILSLFADIYLDLHNFIPLQCLVIQLKE